MMVNFMCHLGHATVPRYLIKGYSGCFCEGVFMDEMDEIYIQISKADYLPNLGSLHLISLRPNGKRQTFPQQEGIFASANRLPIDSN